MVSMAPSSPQQLSLSDLRALSVLGQGARGVVFHVVPVTAPSAADSSATGDPMAMALKAMSRAAARHKSAAGPGGGTCGDDNDDGHRRIWFERDVLLALRHPLLPSLRGVVATDAVVGFAIDRCPGGDLKSLLRRWRRAGTTTTLPDDVIRFYAAELVLVLEYLHGIGVVYRDLKPENVLIQDTGHIMLVDFDLSTTLPPPPPPPPPDVTAQSSPSRPSSHHRIRRKNKNAAAMVFACFSSSRHAATPETTSSQSSQSTSMAASSSSCCSSGVGTPATKSSSFVGTEDYVAPEIVAGVGHDHAVDWWGFGVVLYEMLYGRTPFRGRSRRETFHRVLTAAPPELAAGDDGDAATQLRDLIARLLEKDPRKRLAGAHAVKRHAFFRGVDWGRVLDVARPPFIPDPDGEDGDDAGVEAEEEEGLDVEKVVHEVFGTSGNGEVPQEDVGSDEGRDYDFSMFF